MSKKQPSEANAALLDTERPIMCTARFPGRVILSPSSGAVVAVQGTWNPSSMVAACPLPNGDMALIHVSQALIVLHRQRDEGGEAA